MSPSRFRGSRRPGRRPPSSCRPFAGGCATSGPCRTGSADVCRGCRWPARWCRRARHRPARRPELGLAQPPAEQRPVEGPGHFPQLSPSGMADNLARARPGLKMLLRLLVPRRSRSLSLSKGLYVLVRRMVVVLARSQNSIGPGLPDAREEDRNPHQRGVPADADVVGDLRRRLVEIAALRRQADQPRVVGEPGMRPGVGPPASAPGGGGGKPGPGPGRTAGSVGAG